MFADMDANIFLLSYAVMPSFLVSVLFIDLYLIFEFVIFNVLVVDNGFYNGQLPKHLVVL